MLHLRLTASLHEAARARAVNAGGTISDYVRTLIRLDLERETNELPPVADLADNILYHRAAQGDVLAQREMCERIVERVLSETDEAKQSELFGCAFAFGRLAAEHGKGADLGNLGMLLVSRADIARREGEQEFADMLQCEGVARLNLAADRGDQFSERILAGEVDQAGPNVTADAKLLSEKISEDYPE
jgi:hypothetical protein